MNYRLLYFGEDSQTCSYCLCFIVIPLIAYSNDQKCVFLCWRCWAYCLCALLSRLAIWWSCLHVFNSLNLLLWCFLILQKAVATQICSCKTIQNLREYFWRCSRPYRKRILVSFVHSTKLLPPAIMTVIKFNYHI